MPEPAEDVQADDAVADEAVEQPYPPAATEKPKRARRRVDWRGFVRENARLLITFALLAAGVVFVLLGWYGAAHTNILTEQIPYLISGGLLGLGLIIVAGIIASSAAVERDNRALRDEIAHALAASARTIAAAPGSGSGEIASIYVVPGGQS